MNKKVKALSIAAGARSEDDFILFAAVVSTRDQVRKMRRAQGHDNRVPLDYDYILTHGRFFEPQPLPKGFRRGRAKQCYTNSQLLAEDTDGLIYCEGYVLVEIGGEHIDLIQHGWCVTADRKVIDVTLKKIGLSYLGVLFPTEEIRDVDELPRIETIMNQMREQYLSRKGARKRK